MLTIHQMLDAMWQDYLLLTPDAKPVYELFAAMNDGIVINDHIALRTFNCDKVCLEKMARPFIEAGYVAGGDYDFPAKKLSAIHFQHPDDRLPKVFISELRVEELSEPAQIIIHSLMEQIPAKLVEQQEFCYSGRIWDITEAEYRLLAQESEYASWVAAHGYRPNHFTISINHLKSHQDIHSVNRLLLDQGYQLNDSGGLVKGSPDELLEQSSTKAKPVHVKFSDDALTIPGCYYEFALRYPQADGKLYQGFVAASADKIFESTNKFS